MHFEFFTNNIVSITPKPVYDALDEMNTFLKNLPNNENFGIIPAFEEYEEDEKYPKCEGCSKVGESLEDEFGYCDGATDIYMSDFLYGNMGECEDCAELLPKYHMADNINVMTIEMVHIKYIMPILKMHNKFNIKEINLNRVILSRDIVDYISDVLCKNINVYITSCMIAPDNKKKIMENENIHFNFKPTQL